MNGVARLLNAYGDQLKEDTFKEKLSRVSVKEISRTAKERRAGSLGYAEALLIFYNKKLRQPLKWEALYKHKLPRKSEQETPTDTQSPEQMDIFAPENF